MKLIILNVVPYKENDAIVTALSEEKLITFNARGILKASSKNVAINNPLIVADIELSESKSKFLTLKSSCVILSPYTLDIDLEKMAIIHMMQECINKILQDEEKIEIFKPLFSAINALKVDKLNPLQIFISFLGEILKISGSEFELNGCVHCGNKKELIDFSFEDGGFICKNCYEANNLTKLNSNQMLLLRHLLLNRQYEQDSRYFNTEDALILIDKLITYIYDGIGVHIKSYSLLK